MTPKAQQKQTSQQSPMFTTKAWGFVGKIVTIGKTHSVTIVQNPLQGVAGLAMISIVGLTGLSLYMSLRPSPTAEKPTISNISNIRNEFLINNPPTTLPNQTASKADQEQAKRQVEQYRQATQKNPNDVVAQTNLGEALRRAGDLTGAKQAQGKALQLNPNLIEAKIGGALIKRDEGEVDAAKRELQVFSNQTERAETHYYLGRFYEDEKNFRQAETAYRKALAIAPDNPVIHIRLGMILREQHRLDEAIASVKTAVSIVSDVAGAHFILGLFLSEQGKLDEAIASLKTALHIDPNYAIAHTYLGRSLSEQGKLDEAIASLKTAVSIDPNDAYSHGILGGVLHIQGRLDEAIISFRVSLRIDPDNVQMHKILGLALLQQRKSLETVSEAISELHIAKKLAQAQGNTQEVETVNRILQMLQ